MLKYACIDAKILMSKSLSGYTKYERMLENKENDETELISSIKNNPQKALDVIIDESRQICLNDIEDAYEVLIGGNQSQETDTKVAKQSQEEL